MPKRISADVDMSILQAIACGTRHTDIAREFNVSTSYVSKLNTGKKVPDIYVPSTFATEDIKGDEVLLNTLLKHMETKEIVTKEMCKKYFDQKVREHLTVAKIYLEALKGLK